MAELTRGIGALHLTTNDVKASKASDESKVIQVSIRISPSSSTIVGLEISGLWALIPSGLANARRLVGS